MFEGMIKPVLEAEALGREVSGPAGTLTILRDVGVTVNAAEAVAILGASGSGKSTLLGLLAGLDAPTHGSVRLLGTDLGSLDEDGRSAVRAGKVGFVFQSFQLLPGLTALENVMLPMELSGDESRARDTALETLELVGLGHRIDHYPNQLSGGEQQRVAIARAFAPGPEILFADEPTGNLDQTTGQQIIELLFRLKNERGTALVLVTHDPALAERCERRLRLDAGALVETAGR
ncbi:MAG: ATP-binding cassette domain-containing protein [Chromatiales bacterium]|jgi:putative ABC transport system ATP-binding protein